MTDPRVALYVRKSTDEQAQAYCGSQGWIPVIYDDTASDGRGVTQPNLELLLVEIRAGRVDIVVVTKIDRLGRSLPHLALILEELRAHGVGLIAVSQGLDTRESNSIGSLVLGVMDAVSEFTARTKAGLAVAKAPRNAPGRSTGAWGGSRRRVAPTAAGLAVIGQGGSGRPKN